MIKGLLRPIFVACAVISGLTQSAAAQPNTERDANWASSRFSDEISKPDVQFLDFKLGMTLAEVQDIIRSNSKYKFEGFDAGRPVFKYQENVLGYNSMVYLTPFDYMMRVKVDSDNVRED